MSQSARESGVFGDVLKGACGFALVSLGGFGVWAWFAGSPDLAKRFGEAGLYTASAIVFILLSGLFLHPLVKGSNRIWRFYKAFVPAFVAYAVVWSACWFAFKFGKGEWLASFMGCLAFAFVLGKLLGSSGGFLLVAIFLFLAHSAGYFAGGKLYMSSAMRPSIFSNLSKAQLSLVLKLLWGLCYGLGFGAGIGFAFNRFQKSIGSKTEKTPKPKPTDRS